ncbi:MAG: hypothetical protein E7378_03950 [Clostridiales bacterium]|nr:hypothetical protein [Clostridiales bacterium]
MGYFVKIDTDTKRYYEAVNEKAFSNFLKFARGLRFHKVNFVDGDTCKETYFDTPNHLLNKAGVIVSRFAEGNNVFFKVENAAFMSKILNSLTKQVYVHKVGANDKISDHAFYIKDGITSLFTTAFSVDLENIIKTASPKLTVVINAQIYEVVGGSGMRAKLALENKQVINHETKRKYKVQSMTIKLENNPALYADDFEEFNNLIQKNCKDLIPVNENQFDWANKVTKPLPPKQKEPKKKKKVDKF